MSPFVVMSIAQPHVLASQPSHPSQPVVLSSVDHHVLLLSQRHHLPQSQPWKPVHPSPQSPRIHSAFALSTYHHCHPSPPIPNLESQPCQPSQVLNIFCHPTTSSHQAAVDQRPPSQPQSIQSHHLHQGFKLLLPSTLDGLCQASPQSPPNHQFAHEPHHDHQVPDRPSSHLPSHPTPQSPHVPVSYHAPPHHHQPQSESPQVVGVAQSQPSPPFNAHQASPFDQAIQVTAHHQPQPPQPHVALSSHGNQFACGIPSHHDHDHGCQLSQPAPQSNQGHVDCAHHMVTQGTAGCTQLHDVKISFTSPK